MYRTATLLATGRCSMMIGMALVGMFAAGCGESGTVPSTKPATEATSSPSTTATKKGRGKVDTTSRQELQKQRAAERAKSGQ